MAYWLMKTEPEEFSWNDQVKRGAKGEAWSGVRNFTARRHLKEMKKGEKFFFYHTGEEKQIVGIGEIIREAYSDPTAKKGEPWVAVTTAAVEPLPKPVTLAAAELDAEGEIARLRARTCQKEVTQAGQAHHGLRLRSIGSAKANEFRKAPCRQRRERARA